MFVLITSFGVNNEDIEDILLIKAYKLLVITFLLDFPCRIISNLFMFIKLQSIAIT
jgi:hypothetical protein